MVGNDTEDMIQQKSETTLTARLLAVLISVVLASLGAWVVIDGHAPGRFTRFGFSEALYGEKAVGFGSVLILLGCLPLLLFCKTSHQATIFGSALGLVTVAVVFATAYA